MDIINTFESIKQEIEKNIIKEKIEIIAISKTFPISHIKPLIDYGHTDFGENKVQETEKKWLDIKKKDPKIKLHMVGSLQSNKAKKAVELFDYIHSLDSKKLANELNKREIEKKKKLKYFIQVNLGSEDQKGGVEIPDLKELFNFCKNQTQLEIIGLMAIPPVDNKPDKYFKKISELNENLGLKKLSIGMSNDYLDAIKHGASFVRIGSAIFGKRN
jgi:pyridoxal phosphate enzyme (YggS family)